MNTCRLSQLLASAFFVIPAVLAAQDSPALSTDSIIARVNGVPILLSQMREAALDLDVPVSSLTSDGLEGEGFRKALTMIIDEELLVQEAKKESLSGDETEMARRVDELIRRLVSRLGGDDKFAAFLKESHLTLDTLRTAMLDRERRQDLAAGVVAGRIKLNSAEVEEFRRKRTEAGESAEEVLLAHILIRCLPSERALPVGQERRNRALEAAKKIGRDRGQFGRVALDYSEDAATRERGGMLGWVDPASLAPALKSRVSTMNEGEVSEPVASDLGWHILYLVERHSARDLLFAERFASERAKFIEALRQSAVIEIYPPATK